MGDALSLVTEEARDRAPGTVRSALAFVEIENRGARRGCEAAGYRLELHRSERWRLGRRLVRFDPLAPAEFG